MHRDTTLVDPTADCYQVNNDQTLTAYHDTQIMTYVTVSDKYILSTAKNYDGTKPQEVVCTPLVQVEALPSRYEFIEPIYQTTAIISALFIFWAAYRIMLRPWYRNKL